MNSWTVKVPLHGRYCRDGDGRRTACSFDYVISHTPEVKGVRISHPTQPDPQLWKYFPAVRDGIERALRWLNGRGCGMTGNSIQITHIDPSITEGTTPTCEEGGFSFMVDIAQNHAEVERRGKTTASAKFSAVS